MKAVEPIFVEDAKGPLLPHGTVALGFFDACHLGHQQILGCCKELGGERAAVFTFPNHPSTAIPGRSAPPLVTTSQERIDLLVSMGLKVFLKRFDRAFSSWSAEHFASAMLKEKLGVSHVVVGHDYRFGHMAAGDVNLLADLGAEYGFKVTVIGAVTHAGTEPFVISSTRIRQAVAEGDLMLAHQLMGRPYEVSGVVERGAQQGRTIGFPTANIPFPEGKVRPPFGVVAVRSRLDDGRTFFGVANYGVRPTVSVEDEAPRLEVHLFDLCEELYGRRMTVELRAFVRPEQKFADFQKLREQIESDAAKVRAFFTR